jgi:hypothetical protein
MRRQLEYDHAHATPPPLVAVRKTPIGPKLV